MPLLLLFFISSIKSSFSGKFMVIANNFSITTIFNVKAEITHIFYTFYILLLLLKVKYMKEEYFSGILPT
jgi:hypothetical protein